MSFEERAKKVIAELTEDDINVLKNTQNLTGHSNRLEEIVGRIFDFDYSDSKNYDKIKEIFPDIEDISQDGEVWSENGLDIEIPQITDDRHTVVLWLGLYAEPQLLDDDKGIISPITLQFALETVYDDTSEPWDIITRCVPIPTDKEIEAMKHFTKSEIEAMITNNEKIEEERKDDLMNRYEMEALDISALSKEDFEFLDKEYDLRHNSWAMAERHKDIKEVFIKAVENGDYEVIDLPNGNNALRVMGLSDEHGTKANHGVIEIVDGKVPMDASIDIYDGINTKPVYSMDITMDEQDRLDDVLETVQTKDVKEMKEVMQFFEKSQTPIEIRLRFDFGQDLSHSEIDEDRRELYKNFDTFKKCLYKPEEAEGLDPNTKYLDRVYIGTPYNSGKAFTLEEFWEDDKGNMTGKISFPNCPFSENGTYEIETGYDLPDCTRYYEDGNLLYDYMYEAYSKTEEYAKEITTLTKANVSVEKDNKTQGKGENR